jgi:TldD protein
MLQAGLGAGAGLALWEMYRMGRGASPDHGVESLLAFKDVGLDDRRLARLLEIALENGGNYGDVFLEYSVSNYLIFDGDRLQSSGVEVISGAGIRVTTDGHTAFCATEDLSAEGLTRTARDAAARRGSGGRVSALKPLEGPSFYAVAVPAATEPVREKLEYVLKAVEAAQKADSRIQNVRTIYRDSQRFITVATSDGVIARDTQPSLKITLAAIAADPESARVGMGVFSGGGHYGLEYFKENPPERLGQRAAEMARHQLEGVEPPSATLPVVLGPAYSGVLFHEAVGHGLEADFNVKGYSSYAKRMGEIVASPLCTIYDDGRLPNLNGTVNFDDEGIASSTTLLIDRGRLVSYLHSRETASQMGAAPTGNGRRQSFNFPVLPRMTNTYLRGGDASPEDIIRSVKLGVYARFFSGGSVNTTSGDFNFIPLEAFLIESGRITAPLSNVMLIGNGPEILKRVSMVGNDMQISDNLWECGKMGQMVPVTVGTPTIKIDSMAVGGLREA